MLAVAVAVGAPVLALSGGHERAVQPAPSPRPEVTWVTAVPDDFPLADGFPTPFEVTTKEDPELVPVCGDWQVPAVELKNVHYTGESEHSAQRTLILFKDDDTALAQLAALRAAIIGCDPVPGPRGSHVTTTYNAIAIDHVAKPTDETFAFAEQVRHDDGLVSDLTLVRSPAPATRSTSTRRTHPRAATPWRLARLGVSSVPRRYR